MKSWRIAPMIVLFIIGVMCTIALLARQFNLIYVGGAVIGDVGFVIVGWPIFRGIKLFD
jgi:hypothetical protein